MAGLKDSMNDEGFIVHTAWIEYAGTLSPEDYKEFWSCIVAVKNGLDPTPCKNQMSNFMLAVILPTVKKARKRYQKKKDAKKPEPEKPEPKEEVAGNENAGDIVPEVDLPLFSDVEPETENPEKEKPEPVDTKTLVRLWDMWEPDYRPDDLQDFRDDFYTGAETAGQSPGVFVATCMNFCVARKGDRRIQAQTLPRFAKRKDLFKYMPGNFQGVGHAAAFE